MNDLDNTNETLQEETLAQTPEAAQPADSQPVNEPVETASESAETASPEEVSAPEPSTEAVDEDEAPAETAEPAAEVAAESEAVSDEPAQETPEKVYVSQEEVIARLREITEQETPISRVEVDSLKSHFYRIRKQQVEEARQAFLDNGGNEADWQPQADPLEPTFKELLTAVREKRAAQHEAEMKEEEENYTRKLAIIERIKAILATPEDANKYYGEFKQLQQQWNEIKRVPADKVADLWKTYQANLEQFYDTLKLNNEFRAYDFKKNLEIKQRICERAEALAEETDVVAAFRTLQQLHQEFRETGPVERELREEIWTRFKAASTLINKRHQEYYDSRKEEEQANLAKKTAICEQIEAFELDTLKTFAQWNEYAQKIMELQKVWRTIGYATQKQNQKIYERFRAACDHFFTRKSLYFKSVRENLNSNYKLKQELMRKAEAIAAQFVTPAEETAETPQQPTEEASQQAEVTEVAEKKLSWQAATQQIVDLQKRWKEIGTVPKRYSDEIWKRFNEACNAFFAAKKAVNNGQYAEQKSNLEKKEALIKRLEALDPATADGDIRQQLREAQAEWNEIGHVPYRDKERLYLAFRAQMDRLYNAVGESAPRRRVQRMVERMESHGGNLRDRLQRKYDILQNEIKTYENNLGFLRFSPKSKDGNKLVEDTNRKIEQLRNELAELRNQIKEASKSEEPAEE